MMVSNDGARATNPGTIKVIGIGQSLRGDDAAGLEAVRQWQVTYQASTTHPDVRVDLAEVPGIGLLSLLEGYAVAILVDAVRTGAQPGAIHQITEDQLAAFEGGSGSAHGWGVAETLSMGRQLMPDAMPGKLVLIGIEAGQLNLGESLSPQVKSALPEAVELIEQVVLEELARS